MHVSVLTRNVNLPDTVHKNLDRKIARMKKRLVHFNPDLIEISIVVEQVRKTGEYRTTVNCRLPMRTLRVEESESNETKSVNRAFDVLERQLDKFLARLRHEDERARD